MQMRAKYDDLEFKGRPVEEQQVNADSGGTSVIASSPGIPSSRRRRIVSTLTIASLTEIPRRATTPISERMLIVPPLTPMATTEPARPMGMTNAISSGSRKDSNCAARIM